MPYPTIKRSNARAYLDAVQRGEPASLPETAEIPEGEEADWEALARDLNAELLSLAEKLKNESGKLREFEFEAAAPEIVHSSLPTHAALADGEFWIWLTLIHCRQLVETRYPGSVNLQNYGVGNATENFLYRLWIRAALVYDEKSNDPYYLSRRGKVDFWRSHIFRQRYTNVQKVTKALVRFQFPNENESEPRLKTAQIRELAKFLKRARTNLMFEVMPESRIASFIESESERLPALAD